MRELDPKIFLAHELLRSERYRSSDVFMIHLSWITGWHVVTDNRFIGRIRCVWLLTPVE